MKSYCVKKLPDNVKYINSRSPTPRIVYCYIDNVCIHGRLMRSYEEADAFGLEYLDTDWETFGFPEDTYQVSRKYLDYSREIV